MSKNTSDSFVFRTPRFVCSCVTDPFYADPVNGKDEMALPQQAPSLLEQTVK